MLTRTADPRPLAVSSVTPLPVLDPAAETTLQSSFAPSHRRCAATVARQTSVAAQPQERRSRDGVTLRSESSAAPELRRRGVRPADAPKGFHRGRGTVEKCEIDVVYFPRNRRQGHRAVANPKLNEAVVAD